VGLLAPVRSYIDGLVHRSAQWRALTCARGVLPSNPQNMLVKKSA
jgi:hypothetical protein